MKEFFSYIIIIAVIALMGFICYMIWKKSETETIAAPSRENFKNKLNNFDGRKNLVNEEESDETNTTIAFMEWSVVQLNPESGKAIKKMNLVIPSSGRFTIGRSKDCDFVLQGAKAEDGTSRLHLGVGKDDNGYFAKPISRQDGSLALTYINNVLIIKSFDLTDQQVIWLGNTPIAFVRNVSKKKDLNFNPGTADNKRDAAAFERDHNDTLIFGRSTDHSEPKTFTR